MKEVFARQHNELTVRSGHIWGDRHWPEILEKEAQEDVGTENGDRPRRRKRRHGPGLSAQFPRPRIGLNGKNRPHSL